MVQSIHLPGLELKSDVPDIIDFWVTTINRVVQRTVHPWTGRGFPTIFVNGGNTV